MYFCTVNENSRVMICTLSSAHWRQASKLSAVWRFELIRKHWGKYAHPYHNPNKSRSSFLVTLWDAAPAMHHARVCASQVLLKDTPRNTLGSRHFQTLPLLNVWGQLLFQRNYFPLFVDSAPGLWNVLPRSPRESDSSTASRSSLNTHDYCFTLTAR